MIGRWLHCRATGTLPITDPQMTRFNISLQEGVEMVLWALAHAPAPGTGPR